MNCDPPAAPATVFVACLCAQWCGVCREYQSRFLQMQAKFAHARFVWIDVEDEAELVDPLEVENFPTLLLALGDEVRFFGTLTPQPQTLERLIRSHTQDGATVALADPAAAGLLTRIRAAKLV